ncbi:hypothetical protein ACF0H5_004625 [Mactra antiquata]
MRLGLNVRKSMKVLKVTCAVFIVMCVVAMCSLFIQKVYMYVFTETKIDLFNCQIDSNNLEKGFETWLVNERILRTVFDEARLVSEFSKTVMVTIVNAAYVPFAFSWLCNTQSMGIHSSILVLSTSDSARNELKMRWPDIRVVSLNLSISDAKQDYSTVEYVKIMIHRAELFKALLNAGHEVMLFEFDYVWFENPLPRLQKMNDVDMLVNPVSGTDKTVINGGLIYLFPTEKTKSLWAQLTCKLQELVKELRELQSSSAVSESTNDQTFLSGLWRAGYANISSRELSLDDFADGQWYTTPEEDRKLWNPVMISNNWVIGNDRKIERAKEFGHWFLKDDGQSCDIHQVSKTIRMKT